MCILGNVRVRMLQERLCLKELHGISGGTKREEEDYVRLHAAILLQTMCFSLR